MEQSTTKTLPTRNGNYELPHFDLWKTRLDVERGRGVLSPGAAVTAFGSCFAREAVFYLRRRGYKADPYPAGHLYNTEVVRRELEHVLEGKPWPDDVVLDADGSVQHRYRKACVAKTPDELFERDREITEKAREHLERADVLLVLVGTTIEVWRDSEQGLPTNQIPHPATHARGGWVLDPGELDGLRQDIAEIQRLLSEHTSGAAVYSVCPIPLYATFMDQPVVEANGRNKALLRTALELELTGDSVYLPLWDWMQAQTDRWNPTKADGRHFDWVGLDRVMLFAENYLSAEPVPSHSLGHRMRSRAADLREKLSLGRTIPRK